MKKLIASLLLCMVITSCSTLQTTVKPDIIWSSFPLAEINLADDRWNLLPLLAARLTDYGYSIVPSNTDAADLRVTLHVADGRTLSETGGTVTWPRDLTLQLFDVENDVELARSRYQLAATQSPRHGLDLMLADLHKQIRHASIDTAKIRSQSSTNQQVNTSAQQDTSSSAVPASQTDPVEKTAIVSEPFNTTTSESHPAFESDNTNRSPWQPRFQGWSLSGQDY